MATKEVVLHHEASKEDPVEKIDLLYDRLVKERRTVLFVGEGNFTFTVAFAALRKMYNKSDDKRSMEELLMEFKIDGERLLQHDWEGIACTRFEPEGTDFQLVGTENVKCRPALVLSDVKLACIEESIRYSLTHPDAGPLNLMAIQSVVSLQSVSETCPWQYGVDACAIPDHLLPRDVMWFQCPWSRIPQLVSQLIQDFLLSCAGNANFPVGGYVCIGITKQYPYIETYSLEGLLGKHLLAEDDSTEVLKKYKFLGADDVLIRKLLSFGYRHQGYEDIHESIIDDHVTLVFEKKN